MDYLKEYHKWCTEEVFDKETKKELEAIKNNEDEIKSRKSNTRISKLYKKRKGRRKRSCYFL